MIEKEPKQKKLFNSESIYFLNNNISFPIIDNKNDLTKSISISLKNINNQSK